MIVYVESNFVIEHALRQEDFDACEALVQLCLSKALEIAIPAYCLMEPYETFVRRRSDRKKLKDRIDIEAKQLGCT